SDGSQSPLDPDSLTLGAQGALYTTVKNGKFRARFSQGAQIALGPWLVEGENVEVFLEIAGTRHAFENSREGS
ncbi:MAG TPA: hypothetical protein VGC79_11755, partial [Polyangiaceae bacterium]